jgi:hypothetical protein
VVVEHQVALRATADAGYRAQQGKDGDSGPDKSMMKLANIASLVPATGRQ